MDLALNLRRVISQHVEAAPADEILRITSALCGGRRQDAQSQPITQERFTRIGADGRPLRDGEGEHVAVYDALNDLTWMAEPVAGGEDFQWKDAMDEARGVRLFGCDDWRAPTIQELLSIIDYGRCDPAVDTRFFKGPYGWTWTSTEAAAPAAHAWLVGLGGGDSSRGLQADLSHVRAVRAGQQFAFGFSRSG